MTETYTSNVRLSSTDPQSELVTEVSPGLRVSANGNRIKGYLDYSLIGRAFAQGTSGANIQNALTAFGSFEAIETWAFVDVNASINQQTISALGTQSSSSSLINDNQTETTNVRISPYLRGKLGSLVNYEARYSLANSSSKSALVSDVSTRDGTIKLNGRGEGARLGWTANASHQNVSFSAGRATESDQVNGGLTYAVSPQFDFSLTAGHESNNFSSVDKRGGSTFGLGVNWVPSERTRVSASRQRRTFGDSHGINLSHRTGRTIWTFSDSQDAVVSPSQAGLSNLGSNFDLFFEQFASIEPDLTKRAALVTNFLQTNGIDPAGAVISSFLSSGISLQRRQNLSFSLLGLRDTVTVTATRSDTSRLDSITTATDDLSSSSSIRQSGLSVSLAHRLTPVTSVTILGLTQQSSDSSGLQETSSKTINLSLSTKLGSKSTAAVNARRAVFDSRTSPYTESAISGTLNVQF